MLAKVLLITVVVLLSSQIVQPKSAARKWYMPELKLNIIKPMATKVLYHGLEMLLPENYNADPELNKYINFTESIGNALKDLLASSINLLDSAKTNSREPDQALGAKAYDATESVVTNMTTLLKYLLRLSLELRKTFTIIFTTRHLDQKINELAE